MKPLLNLDEPVQRRTGEPARIICRDALGGYPVIALMATISGRGQYPQSFTLRGSSSTDFVEHPSDLINVPKRVLEGTVFLKCYLMDDGGIVVRTGDFSGLEGLSSVIGAKAFRLVVKRGEWI